MKLLRLFLSGLLCLCGLAALLGIGAHQFGGQFLARKIRTAIESSLGGEARFAYDPQVTIFPPGAELKEFSWQKGDAAFSLASAKIVLDPWPLLTGKYELKELWLESPYLACTEGVSLPKPRDSASPGISVDNLIIRNGLISCLAAKAPVRISNLNLSLQKDKARQDYAVQGNAAIRAGAGESPLLAGAVTLKCRVRHYAPNISLRFGQLSYTPAGSMARPAQMTFDGSLNTGTGKIPLIKAGLNSGPLHLGITGTGDLRTFTFAGQWAGEASGPSLDGNTTKATAGGTWDYEPGEIELAPLDLSLGSTKGRGYILLSFSPGEVDLSGNIRLGSLALEDLPDVPSGTSAASSPGTAVPQGFSLDLNLDIAALTWRKLSIPAISARLKGHNGQYALDPVKSGNDLLARASLNGASGDFLIECERALFDAGSLLTQLGFPSEGGQASISGRLSGNLHGNAATRARSLNGVARADMRDLQLDELKKLNTDLKRFLPGSIPDGIAELELTCTARAGEFTLSPFIMRGNDFFASGKAVMDLPRNSASGSLQIHAFDLDIPVAIAGTASAPRFSLEPSFLPELEKKFF